MAAGVGNEDGEAVLVAGLASELEAGDVEESEVGVVAEFVAVDVETVIEAVDTEASALVVVNEAALDMAEVGFAAGDGHGVVGEPVTALELDVALQHGVDVVG